ncbi:MAG: alpha/beta hydrolase [Kibdelosporangium sp.]
MTYLEHSDHPEIFTAHAYPEHIVDLGEIRMNYAVAGDPGNAAILLVPGQSESWWGYEEAMRLLAGRFQVYAVDLRGQGRSTWTPGRYSLDLFGGDLVRFIDRVIGRPVVVCGLSSGGVIAAWLSAFAAPGQIRAAAYEDPPLFASEVEPAVGQSIRQGVAGPMFRLWAKWLGPQWSIGDEEGMMAALPNELPEWTIGALQAAGAANNGELPMGARTDLREYDPEWGAAFWSGRVGITCDHEAMLTHVKVPVLFTHHFHYTDPDTGNLVGAISEQQARHVRRLVEGTGNSFTYRVFPNMPHSMHGADPVTYVATVTEWLDGLDAEPVPVNEELRAGEPVPSAGEAGAAPGDSGPISVDGTWLLTIETRGGRQQVHLTLATAGAELTGTLGESAIEAGTVEGSVITFKAQLTSPVKLKINCSATVGTDTMTGQAEVALMPISVPFTGVRVTT